MLFCFLREALPVGTFKHVELDHTRFPNRWGALESRAGLFPAEDSAGAAGSGAGPAPLRGPRRRAGLTFPCVLTFVCLRTATCPTACALGSCKGRIGAGKRVPRFRVVLPLRRPAGRRPGDSVRSGKGVFAEPPMGCRPPSRQRRRVAPSGRSPTPDPRAPQRRGSRPCPESRAAARAPAGPGAPRRAGEPAGRFTRHPLPPPRLRARRPRCHVAVPHELTRERRPTAARCGRRRPARDARPRLWEPLAAGTVRVSPAFMALFTAGSPSHPSPLSLSGGLGGVRSRLRGIAAGARGTHLGRRPHGARAGWSAPRTLQKASAGGPGSPLSVPNNSRFIVFYL